MTDTPPRIESLVSTKRDFNSDHRPATLPQRQGFDPDMDTDEKGRPLIQLMTDREILVELVTGQRQLADALEQLEQSPMMRAMMSGQNPLMAMMGRKA